MAIGNGMLTGGAMRPVYGGMLAGGVSLLILAGLAEPAKAASVTYGATYNTSSGGAYNLSNWNTMNFGPSDQLYLSFPKFDTTLGQLTKVTLSFTESVKGSYTANADRGSGLTFTTLIAELSMAVWNAPTDAANRVPPVKSISISQDSGATNYNVIAVSQGGTYSVNIPEQSKADSVVYTSSEMLRAFEENPHVLYASGLNSTLVGKSGSFDYTEHFLTSGKMTGSVTYEYSYNSVPEAGTLFLGGCVIVPLLTHRRRTPMAEAGN